jgi:predicted MFS family arabinose efflux permease
MAAATFTINSLSVLATFIIDDLSITREQLGYAVSANVVLAAVLSPWIGRVVDRIGGRAGLGLLFLIGGLAFVLMGAAVAYWVLVLGAVVAAASQGSSNPATNRLIAQHIVAGRRGLVTGVKQSGVQAGSFVGGLLLPVGATVLGWRPSLAISGFLMLVMIIPTLVVIPSDRPDAEQRRVAGLRLPVAANWLAAYGVLIGFVSLFGRVGWARYSERGARFIWSLRAIGWLSIVSAIMFLFAGPAPVLLWTAVVVAGMSSSSWQSVGMLAVMHEAGTERTGRASGRVMLGFLMGFGVAPPIYGRTVDVTGSYTVMWWTAIVAFALAVAVIALWARTVARADGPGIASPGREEGSP